MHTSVPYVGPKRRPHMSAHMSARLNTGPGLKSRYEPFSIVFAHRFFIIPVYVLSSVFIVVCTALIASPHFLTTTINRSLCFGLSVCPFLRLQFLSSSIFFFFHHPFVLPICLPSFSLQCSYFNERNDLKKNL